MDETAAVDAAIAAAEVGAECLPVPLADLGAVRTLAVEGDTGTVAVRLPIPPGPLRRTIADQIGAAVRTVDGVEEGRCRFDPAPVDPGERVDLIPDVSTVVAVASGKGGVGKSTVAVNLATGLAAGGASVGLLDADVYGPNAPAMLGLGDRTPGATLSDRIVPREAHGVQVMSMGFVVGEDDPVIWRGPLVDEFLTQLFDDVAWGSLDYLVVDLPPGTGDAQLSLVQHLPLTGAVVVTTPQAVAVDDARRGLAGFRRYDVPVLGLVENMAGFECPDCGSDHDLFDSGGADDLADEADVPVLGRIPIDPAIGATGGEPAPRRGLSLPGIGSVGLPRTRPEREGRARGDPSVLTEGQTGTAFQGVTVRTAAALDRVSRRVAGDSP